MKTFIQFSTITLTGNSGEDSTTTTTTLTGDSGDEYDFEVTALGADLDPVGAVYAITRMEGGEHVVLYIGHTGDLSDRFSDHHKSECFDDNDADYLCVHRDGDKESRLKKESDLMSRYRPTCNGPRW
jgi:hypothetical protein